MQLKQIITLAYLSRDFPNFAFSEKSLEIVFLPHVSPPRLHIGILKNVSHVIFY